MAKPLPVIIPLRKPVYLVTAKAVPQPSAARLIGTVMYRISMAMGDIIIVVLWVVTEAVEMAILKGILDLISCRNMLGGSMPLSVAKVYTIGKVFCE